MFCAQQSSSEGENRSCIFFSLFVRIYRISRKSNTNFPQRMQERSPTLLDLADKHLGDGPIVSRLATSRHTTLTELNLQGNGIGEEGTKALARLLRGNPTVTKVNLRDNAIGKEGVRALGEALRYNTTLTELDLSYNKLGEEGGRVMGECLQDNISLSVLHLAWNGIGTEGAKRLLKVFENNYGLTTVSGLELYPGWKRLWERNAKRLREQPANVEKRGPEIPSRKGVNRMGQEREAVLMQKVLAELHALEESHQQSTQEIAKDFKEREQKMLLGFEQQLQQLHKHFEESQREMKKLLKQRARRREEELVLLLMNRVASARGQHPWIEIPSMEAAALKNKFDTPENFLGKGAFGRGWFSCCAFHS